MKQSGKEMDLRIGRTNIDIFWNSELRNRKNGSRYSTKNV